jgi:hypothetical protein
MDSEGMEILDADAIVMRLSLFARRAGSGLASIVVDLEEDCGRLCVYLRDLPREDCVPSAESTLPLLPSSHAAPNGAVVLIQDRLRRELETTAHDLVLPIRNTSVLAPDALAHLTFLRQAVSFSRRTSSGFFPGCLACAPSHPESLISSCGSLCD